MATTPASDKNITRRYPTSALLCTMATIALSTALGGPPPAAPLGTAWSPVWCSVRAALRTFLPLGLPRVRSPSTLWQLVCGDALDYGSSWRCYCQRC